MILILESRVHNITFTCSPPVGDGKYLHGLFSPLPVLQGSVCSSPQPCTFSSRPCVQSTGCLAFLCTVHRLDIVIFLCGNDGWGSRLACPWAADFGLCMLKKGIFSSFPSFTSFFHFTFGSLSRRPGHWSRPSPEVGRTEPGWGSPAGTLSHGLLVSLVVAWQPVCWRGTGFASQVCGFFWFGEFFCVCVVFFLIFKNNTLWS